MAKHTEEEGIIPARALDFASNRGGVGMRSQDIKGEPAQDGKVLGSVVLSGTVSILGEVNIEHPVELVLDAPVASGDVQQPLGRDVFGEEIVAHERRIGRLRPGAPARGDAPQRDNAGKAMACRQAGVAHDGGTPRFVPIVTGGVDLCGAAALARSCKLLRDRFEQRATVGLDRQCIVATRSTALAKARLQCSASAVTIQPSRLRSSNTSKAPAVSFRPGAFC